MDSTLAVQQVTIEIAILFVSSSWELWVKPWHKFLTAIVIYSNVFICMAKVTYDSYAVFI